MLVLYSYSRYNLLMYKHILAAVNEFTNSEVAARYAIALAKSSRAALSFIFIAEANMDTEVFRRAESALERLFIEAERQDIEVESITERGDPLRRVMEVVQKNRTGIVFAATRRTDIEKRFFLRTHAKEFMLTLPCSVAMVRVVHMGRVVTKSILVPVKGRMSHIEERSCFVAKLAESFGSGVTLFHLAEPLTRYFHGEVHLSRSQREERVPQDIEEFTGCLRRYGVHHEKKTRFGSISREITIEAAHKRNDLIVMGASERGLVRSIVSGNPVESVLRETPCNLIVFRPRKTERDS